MSTKSPGGLTNLTYQILVSLADADRHGYGIIKEIEGRAGTGSAPTTGALYLALQRMEGTGLITLAEPSASGGDSRRRYYALTSEGREVARRESHRLATLVAQARAKHLVG